MSLSENELVFPQWPAPARVRAFATTRHGGISRGAYESLNLGIAVGDDLNCVHENRARVFTMLPSAPRWLKQVHGTHVVDAGAIDNTPEADASFTRERNVVCVIQMADCLPVLLCAKDGSCVAAAHAGWRGLAAGVLERAVAALDVPSHELIAWLGPAIGPDAFEVGTDVRSAFLTINPADQRWFRPKSEDKWLADLFSLARSRLNRAGIDSVFGGGLCTYSDAARFFSHRRDRVSGRMAAMIWLSD